MILRLTKYKYKETYTMTEKLNYSYDQIAEIIKSKSKEIIDVNPDYIIAIGGGGLIPARMLRPLVKKPIHVVTLALYSENDEIGEKVNIIQWIDKSLDLKDKKILVIDEIDDTRKTMLFCIDKLREFNNANNISVFVVHNKLKDKVGELQDVNYISGENIEDKWVVYPWDEL